MMRIDKPIKPSAFLRILLLVIASNLLLTGGVSQADNCSGYFFDRNPTYVSWGTDCIPDYVQDQAVSPCKNSNGQTTALQSVAWLKPMASYDPWEKVTQITSGDVVDGKADLVIYLTRYTCTTSDCSPKGCSDAGKRAGTGGSYFWPRSWNLKFRGGGWTKDCGRLYDSRDRVHEFLKFDFDYDNSSSSDRTVANQVHGYRGDNNGAGTFSGWNRDGINSWTGGIKLNIAQFTDLCVNQGIGCTKTEADVYSIPIATVIDGSNRVCKNGKTIYTNLGIKLPVYTEPAATAVGSSLVNGKSYTEVYPGDEIRFKHNVVANYIGDDPNESILFKYKLLYDDDSHIVDGIVDGGQEAWRSLPSSVSMSNPEASSGDVFEPNKPYIAKASDINRTICRKVGWWIDDNGDYLGYSEPACVKVIEPPCNYKIDTSVKGPGEIVVNRYNQPNLSGKFTHKLDYNITSTEVDHKCSISGSFDAWVQPGDKQRLLNLAGKLPETKNNKNPHYTKSFDDPLKWTGFKRTTRAGIRYCEHNQAVSTNNYSQQTKIWPQASDCAIARRDNYNLDLSCNPIINGKEVANNVAQPGFLIKFQHNVKANKALTDKFSVSLQQAVVDINTNPNNGSVQGLVNGVDVYPYYSQTDITGAGERRDDLWWNKDGEVGTVKANNSHLDQRICQRLVTKELADLGNTGGNQAGGWCCALVPYQYKLTPNIRVNDETAGTPVIPGAVIPITGSVNNSGPTRSRNVNWTLSKFILEPGQTTKNPGNGRNYEDVSQLITSLSPSQFFNHRGYESRQSDNRVFDLGDALNFVTDTFTIPNTAKIGEKYCFSLSVQPYSATYPVSAGDNHWRHAQPICVVVSKRPITQVHGAGLILPNGSTKGSITVRPSDSTQYGSWMEYDILSGNLTTPADEFVASNAGHLINLGTASKDKWHQLTFANTPIYGKFGTNLPANRAQSLFSYYSGIAKTSANTIAKPAGDVVLHNLSYPSTIHYMSNIGGTLTLSGQLPNHKSLIVIQDGGNVVINGNITYQNQGGFSKASDFSQLIIIVRNGNIIINENVTQVDAWLVATGNNPNRGRLKTCNKTDDKVSMHDCVELLTVNGPVIVDYVDLLRTRGNDIANNTLGQPAEVFNFRPDSYLWAIGRSPELPVFETTHTKDLPPRY